LAKAQLKRLQEDFLYNLQLLEDRDKELDKFEAVAKGLRAELFDRYVQKSSLFLTFSYGGISLNI